MRRGFKFGSFAASAVVDFKGQISSLQQNQDDRSNPSEMKSGPSFWFDRQTADDFQKLPAKVCMRTVNVCVCVCVNYMVTEAKPQQFCGHQHHHNSPAP